MLIMAPLAIEFRLPSQFRAERSIVVNTPADKVHSQLVAPGERKRSTAWNQRDPAMKIEYGGPASGVGARWTWQSETEGG